MSNLQYGELSKFLKNKMTPDDYIKTQEHINQFLKLGQIKFQEEFILQWKADQWNLSNKDKQSICLSNKDSEYPFNMLLTMVTNTGKPVVKVTVTNIFSQTVVTTKEIQLKTKKSGFKDPAKELSYYWENGSILKYLKEFSPKEPLSFEESIKILNSSFLTDCNNRKFTMTASKCIAYMYAQIKNRSGHVLTDEPIYGWKIPKNVSSRISSGLADSLQDYLHLAYSTQNEQVLYKKFIKNYPTVNAFATNFDSKYC